MKRIIVFSAPSGVGKSTLIKKVAPLYPQIFFSVSATTRPQRSGEVDGKDYYFMDKATFQRHLDNHNFLEHAHVYSHWYGTLLQPIRQALDEGKWPLFDVDAQGLDGLKKRFGADEDVDIVSVLILPKTMDVLKQRLTQRATDAQDVIEKRMVTIYDDIQAYAAYTYVVINDDLQECVNMLDAILKNHPISQDTHPDCFMHSHAQFLLTTSK